MSKIRNIIFTAFYAVATLLLAGCKTTEGVLDPKGLIALSEKHLLIDAVLLMLIVVIPVIILTGVIAWKYRAKNTAAKYDPDWSHSTALEVVWWTIPCVIIVILAVITWVSSHRLDPYRPLDIKTKPITIQVIALEWKWLFIYPEQHIATVNFVQMPVNVPVQFLITSDAPMNSFQIPQLAGQIYAMAGMQTKLNLIANTSGDYRGLSSNYSGSGFNYMKFNARVTSQADFDKWVKQMQAAPDKLDMDAYNKLSLPSRDNPFAYFSGVTEDLFNSVIMKFMMPMPALKQEENGQEMQGKQVMKAMQDAQDEDYTEDRDYGSRYNKNKVPPLHK